LVRDILENNKVFIWQEQMDRRKAGRYPLPTYHTTKTISHSSLNQQ